MPGRPKMMAKRVEVFSHRATAFFYDILKVVPDQYRVQGMIWPEWAEEEDELLATAPQSKKIELYWRACIGHVVQLEMLLRGLACLLREKTGLPAMVDPVEQVPAEWESEHRDAQADQAGEFEADNPADAEGPGLPG